MKKDTFHKGNRLRCMWSSIVGKLDAQVVRWKLKPKRESITCQEFTTFMQDVVDEEMNQEELRLFKHQQEKCQGCSEKFVVEQETLSLIKAKLQHQKLQSPVGFDADVRNQVLLY